MKTLIAAILALTATTATADLYDYFSRDKATFCASISVVDVPGVEQQAEDRLTAWTSEYMQWGLTDRSEGYVEKVNKQLKEKEAKIKKASDLDKQFAFASCYNKFLAGQG